jgi:hypothetical protein
MNKMQAVKAHVGDIFEHVTETNADGTPTRVRVTGMCKTWKTRSDEFQLPWKHGFYGPCGYMTHLNQDDWTCMCDRTIKPLTDQDYIDRFHKYR